MALVRSVILAAIELGSILSVRGSTSAKTTVAPRLAAAFAVEIQLIGVVMTSSPGPTAAAIMASSSPAVADETANPYSHPQNAANASSNSLTLAPQDGADAFNTSRSASASS